MAGFEDITNFNFGGLADQAAGGAYTVVMTILALAIFVGIALIIWFILQFKHRIIIKVMTRQGSFIVQDKAREVNENGVTFWKLLKRKHLLSPPPVKAVHMTKKGKFAAECYYSEETGYSWALDNISEDDFKQKLTVEEPVLNERGEQQLTKEGKLVTRKVVKDAFQPFTAQERALQAARITRAMARKRKNLLETIAQLATPIALIMLILGVIIFWEDIYGPVKEQSEINVKISAENAKISEQNARVLSVMRNDGQLQVNQNIGGDAGG